MAASASNVSKGTILVCDPPPDDEDQSADIFESTQSSTLLRLLAKGECVAAAEPPGLHGSQIIRREDVEFA